MQAGAPPAPWRLRDQAGSVFPAAGSHVSAQVLGLGCLHCKQHRAWD